jgi:hypothetical protein
MIEEDTRGGGQRGSIVGRISGIAEVQVSVGGPSDQRPATSNTSDMTWGLLLVDAVRMNCPRLLLGVLVLVPFSVYY